MKNHEGCVRAYHRVNKAYYSKYLPSEPTTVMVGMYEKEGGTSGEFSFEWIELSGKITPILKSFNDSWHALSQFKDLLEKMAEVDEENISEPEFCKIRTIIKIVNYEKVRKEISLLV